MQFAHKRFAKSAKVRLVLVFGDPPPTGNRRSATIKNGAQADVKRTVVAVKDAKPIFIQFKSMAADCERVGRGRGWLLIIAS
jgi:hypothetical protein